MRWFLKAFLLVSFLLTLLSGCAASKKTSVLAKETDSLIVSSCAKCSKEPFYVNGQWLGK
jgi:hypothetical protein